MRLLLLTDPALSGDDVRHVQSKLKSLGLYNGDLDGDFGPKTGAAVREFQRRARLDIDGIVGEDTLESLGILEDIQFADAPAFADNGWHFEPPNGLAEWEERYGIPTGRLAWERHNLVLVDLSDLRGPFSKSVDDINTLRVKLGLLPNDYPRGEVMVRGVGDLYYPLPSGEKLDFFATRINPVTGVRGYGFLCHRLTEDIWFEFFARLVDADLLRHLRTFNGSYVFRQVRGGSRLSAHAFGAAVDLDPATNQMGHMPTMSTDIVHVAEEMGFTWGGRWSRPDGMHFQWGS